MHSSTHRMVPLRLTFRRLQGLLALILYLLAARSAHSECNKSFDVEQQIALIDKLNHTNPLEAAYNIGLVLLDASCYPEALSALHKAQAVLATDGTLSKSQEDLPTLVAAAIVVTEASEEFDKTGRIVDSRRGLLNVLHSPSTVSARALLRLVPHLEVNDDLWNNTIQPFLEVLAARRSWEATRILAQHLVKTHHSDRAIALLDTAIEESTNLQHQLALRMTLVQVLAENGRIVEARLLLAGLEQEAGDQLLSLFVRVEFLRVAVEVTTIRVKAGDVSAQEELEVYSQALQEVLQP